MFFFSFFQNCTGLQKCKCVFTFFYLADVDMESSAELLSHRSEQCCFSPQYSQKEDKYEEEIKILTDKLKEVSEKE